jgi:hypothetical protein
VVGQDFPRGVASVSGRSAWQVHDQVGILGHRSYCARVHRRFNLRKQNRRLILANPREHTQTGRWLQLQGGAWPRVP